MSHRIRPDKPGKPHPDFPLFPHATGRWAKKIKGKLYYFGKWADPAAALAKYLDQKDDLLAGRPPRTVEGGTRLGALLNLFLTSKKALVEAGELRQRTYFDYDLTCDRLAAAMGADRNVLAVYPADFEAYRATLTKKWGPVAVSNEIQRVRTIFKYAFDSGLIDKPTLFGPGFNRPTRKVLRQARHGKGLRMFEPAEVAALLAAGTVHQRAMILLGLNAGYGNADVGTVPAAALDLDGGWATYPRPKTGVARRAWLWPETVAALRASLARRAEPKRQEDAGLFFLTVRGGSWFKEDTPDNPVSKQMAKLLKAQGLYRPGLNFYALRHTFETVAGESKDQVAVDYVMGHARDDMASVYRERIGDDRVRAVCRHVRAWLYGPPAD